MAKRTQKAGATARFGARYGVSVRRNSASAMAKKSKKYTCPVCQYQKVSRKSVGIWQCSKCATILLLVALGNHSLVHLMQIAESCVGP